MVQRRERARRKDLMAVGVKEKGRRTRAMDEDDGDRDEDVNGMRTKVQTETKGRVQGKKESAEEACEAKTWADAQGDEEANPVGREDEDGEEEEEVCAVVKGRRGKTFGTQTPSS